MLFKEITAGLNWNNTIPNASGNDDSNPICHPWGYNGCIKPEPIGYGRGKSCIIPIHPPIKGNPGDPECFIGNDCVAP